MSTLNKLEIIDTSLNNIRNAIVAKGQTPTGDITTYANAIEHIPVSEDAQNLADYINGTAVDVVANGITRMAVAYNNNSTIRSFSSNTLESITVNEYDGFQNADSLERVYLPALTTLDAYKFLYGCNSLLIVSMPKLTTIYSSNTFSYCQSLDSVSLPELIKIVGSNTFSENNLLYRLSLPKLKEISSRNDTNGFGGGMCYNCKNLESVSMPSLIEIIGNAKPNGNYTNYYRGLGTFRNCPNLRSIDLPVLEKLYFLNNNNSSEDGLFNNCTSLRNVYLPKLQKIITDRLFYNCISIETLDFPELISLTDDIISQSSYVRGCFESCTSLQSITLPKLEVLKGAQAFFSKCSALTTLVFPSLTQISLTGQGGSTSYTTGYGFFYNCTGLKSIDFPALEIISNTGVKTQSPLFYGCSALQKVWIPRTCTTITASTINQAPFINSNSACEIWTDIPSAEDVPAGFGQYWNYFNASTPLTVHYGATHADFEAAPIN